MPRQPQHFVARDAVLTTRPEFGDSGRARRVESKQSKILNVLRQSKGPGFEHQDAMAARFVLVKKVLSEYRPERASPDDDDVKGTSIIIIDRKSTRLNSSHVRISYAVFCLKKKKHDQLNVQDQLHRLTSG